MVKKIGLYIVIAFCMCFFISCSSKENEPDIILDSFLYQAVDSLIAKHDINDKIIIYQNSYPDNAKKIMIRRIIEDYHKENGETDSPKISLLKEIDRILDDTVRLEVDEKKFNKYSFYHTEESIKNLVDFNSDQYFGSISLSNVAINDDQNFAGFYIAIQCGNRCSEGYIIFLSKEKNGWVLSDINKVWEG